MKIQIQGVPTFFFHLTLEEVEIIVKLALAHYDFGCKRAAGPGGILAEWKRDLLVAKEIQASQPASEEPYNPALKAKWSDLDLVAKICEPISTMGFSEDVKVVANKIYTSFMGVMRISNEKYNEWRHEVESS